MELWDIYDENRVKKDGVMKRGEPIRDGDYHLVVHVCVFDRAGRMLIQKRQPFKSGMHTVSGAYQRQPARLSRKR